MKRLSFLLLLSVATTSFLSSAHADVRLPGFFGDHMVLQQEKDIVVWGWADINEKVNVALGDTSQNATADGDGRWKVTLPAMKASKQSHTLVVKAANTIELKDVLIGEVWLCSGQSNMEWTVAASANAKEEIAAANHPMIRHMKVKHTPSTTPRDGIPTSWEVCSSDTIGSFTACGYFMARELQAELDVPIGLVNSSWGGTRVEPWTPPVGFQKVEAVQDIYAEVQSRTPGTKVNLDLQKRHVAATEAWLAQAKALLDEGKPVAANPAYPPQLKPYTSHQSPTMLYNGMIHALVGFPIRGAIWYQGESNHADGMLYAEKKKALINGWRELWGQGDFPFYYVQIAPFKYGNENSAVLAQFWEAQAAVQELPNTGMVVINDIATVNNIHPPNKQDVGKRLALLALKHDYGKDVVARSPEMQSVVPMGGQLKVTFKNTGGGLKTRDGKSPTHFQITGPGAGGFQDATATIDGDSVLLTSQAVSTPTAVRFAWDKVAEPNLTGATGLPVGAFRGGKEPDFGSLLSVEKDFQLVYDLDLSKLGSDIKYNVDNSGEVTSFSQVGYLVELRSDSGDQAVFVSMDAFTDDAKKIGVPTAASGIDFRTEVTNLKVFTTVEDMAKGEIAAGNIEFWPNNYSPANERKVPGASNGVYDFGDAPGPPANGYGSMQIHNTGAKQTVFAINHWKQGARADIGIGNSTGQSRDWTFTANAGTYEKKRLRVYVK